MSGQVRTAEAADADAVARLEAIAADQLADQRGGAEVMGDASTGPPLPAPTERWHVAVAVVDGLVMGVARTERVGEVAVLRMLFTHPGARRIGLGHRLLTDALDRARTWGCARMESTALPGDRATKNFFEAHGLVTRRLVVGRSLDG